MLIFQYLENFGTELGDQILSDSKTDAINLIIKDIDAIFVENVENTLHDITVEEFTDGNADAVSVNSVGKAIEVRIDLVGCTNDFVDLE